MAMTPDPSARRGVYSGYSTMRSRLACLVMALVTLSGCSVVSIDLTPPVRPLRRAPSRATARRRCS